MLDLEANLSVLIICMLTAYLMYLSWQKFVGRRTNNHIVHIDQYHQRLVNFVHVQCTKWEIESKVHRFNELASAI